MDTMHESHTGQLLPRLEAGGAVLAQFAEHCLDCKVWYITGLPALRSWPLLRLAAPLSKSTGLLCSKSITSVPACSAMADVSLVCIMRFRMMLCPLCNRTR